MADIVYDAILGSSTLRQVRSVSLDESLQLIAGRYSGGVDPQDHFIDSADPRATLQTADLGTLLGISNFLTRGLSIVGGTVTLPFNKRANGSTFASGSSHFTISASNAMIIPTQFSATQNGGGATASVETILYSAGDGFTRPYSLNVNQSLAAQAFQGMYDLGPVSINGVALPKVTGVTVNAGLSVNGYRHNGGVWFDEVFVEQVEPTIEVTCQDFDQMASYVGGLAISNIGVFMRKKASGSTYVANGTGQHIRFGFTAGVIQNTTFSADGVSPGSGTIRFTGRSLTGTSTSTIS